ncbi:MAG: hypothetical protein WD845_16095 [Pirellulales bacterium]
MLRLAAEIDRRDRVLSRVGWLHVALLIAMLAAAAFDTRQALGINIWIKPSKFAASIAIYVWTLAWLMEYVRGPSWAKGLIRWGVAVAMVVEILCIAGQSLRGTTSHFNQATALDTAAFAVMGAMIVFNTLLEGLVLILFLKPYPALPPAYLLGIRLGLLLALVSAGVGGMMIGQGAHTVGAADGGPGLPLVNFSTVAGDLRIAHALGLHAFQILPLAGYLLSRWWSRGTSILATGAVAAIYAALTAWTLMTAMEGKPLVGWPAADPAPGDERAAALVTFRDKASAECGSAAVRAR